MTLAITLLVGATSAWAQSAGSQNSNAGRQGSSTMNNARKANTSQTMGKGVPYNKDKEQRRSEAKGGTPTSTGSSATAQTRKSGAKAGTSSPKSGSGQ